MRGTKLLILSLGILMGTGAAAQVGMNQGLVNPNLADESELRALPHMTDRLANAIVDARPILTPAQLDDLLGALSAEQKTELYGRLWRPLNLNTASEDEIMLIPDMTSRMAHEFEEYRPYTSMEQFRVEIGKYVDDAEVARLEQYVFSPMDLNTSSSEDFITIPGMNERMVHEFKEYRPYTSMKQFRVEIGKYVDAAEVARLESYVVLND